jgi:hypothetical protein
MTMYLAWRVSSQQHLRSWVDLLIANQHLHILFDHEVVVIRRQSLGRRVVPAHRIVSLLKCSAEQVPQGKHSDST